jgi:Alanine-zipper, major outer membrane lipoprotein
MARKLIILVVILALGLFSFGCVTKDYVKQQIDPLTDRISKIEAMDCCTKADNAAQRAEDAARKAQEAADRAESASHKAGKAFELQQMK